MIIRLRWNSSGLSGRRNKKGNEMAKYTVELSTPGKHTLPPLLTKFGEWLAKQDHGSIGWFDIQTESIPKEWNPDVASRLDRDGFSFLHLPDGSLLALLKTGKKTPPAVVLLGSEGETGTIANSLEEFLILLSRGETGIDDLDAEEAEGRSKLKSWLSRNKVEAPQTKGFDFDAYLDGEKTTSKPAKTVRESIPNEIANLPPLFRRLVQIMGRRADDPEVIDFVTETMKKKVPDSTTDVNKSKNVVDSKQGIEMSFGHDVKNDNYPLIPKSKSSFIPYLQVVWIQNKFPELPFGLKFGMTEEEITSKLGTPERRPWGSSARLVWNKILDPNRDIVLTVDLNSITLGVTQAGELTTRSGVPSRAVVGLFVAWAIGRNLLDESRFTSHLPLMQAIRERKLQGTAFVDAALPRGLWDNHLKSDGELKRFAYGWFHNIGSFIRDDLVAVFGKREGPTGHDEPILDNDDWVSVDKATPILDERFAKWTMK
jgi:hypothetical protein